MHSLLLSSESALGVNACLFVLGLLVCLLLSGLLKKHSFAYLPESAAFILVGLVGGLLGGWIGDEAEVQFLEFSPRVVFFAMLPPIILDAGYTLKRRDFFRTLGRVLLLATAGTVLNNLVFGYLLYGFAQAGWVPLDKSGALECLLFGAALSATDPVATLSVMGSKLVGADPKLYSLVMGESVLNDAVAIVLYKAFEKQIALPPGGSEEELERLTSKPFTFVSLLQSLVSFVGVSIGSVCVGVAIGLSCCFLCKRVNLNRYPLSELTVVTLFSYFSYVFAEMCGLSGIMSLFFAAICLAHYCYYSLTPTAQVATHESFKSAAQISETALYVLIGVMFGLSLVSDQVLTYDAGLGALTILACLIARAAHVFPLIGLSNLRSLSRDQVPWRMQLPLWSAGLRGGVSFALVLSFPGPHRKLVMGATLVLVLFTTFVCGGLTLPILRLTGMTAEARAKEAQALQMQQRGDGSVAPSPPVADTIGALDDGRQSSDLGEGGEGEDPELHGLFAHFRTLDKKYLRRWFGSRDATRDADGNMHDASEALLLGGVGGVGIGGGSMSTLTLAGHSDPFASSPVSTRRPPPLSVEQRGLALGARAAMLSPGTAMHSPRRVARHIAAAASSSGSGGEGDSAELARELRRVRFASMDSSLTPERYAALQAEFEPLDLPDVHHRVLRAAERLQELTPVEPQRFHELPHDDSSSDEERDRERGPAPTASSVSTTASAADDEPNPFELPTTDSTARWAAGGDIVPSALSSHVANSNSQLAKTAYGNGMDLSPVAESPNGQAEPPSLASRRRSEESAVPPPARLPRVSRPSPPRGPHSSASKSSSWHW